MTGTPLFWVVGSCIYCEWIWMNEMFFTFLSGSLWLGWLFVVLLVILKSFCPSCLSRSFSWFDCSSRHILYCLLKRFNSSCGFPGLHQCGKHNCKFMPDIAWLSGKRSQVVLTVINHGEGLPDAYDSKRKSGRWKYCGKLGEGGLGVVYRAVDALGRLQGDIAIKVCKLAKNIKAAAKLRSAFKLHREAQWSLQLIHNSMHKSYSQQRAGLFARYLEDHTGHWSTDSNFDAERSTFEAANFRWDKFEPPSPLPSYPYVAMEFVPGRTVHSALGWSRHHPLKDEAVLTHKERESIIRQATQALIYLIEMGLIHRDFRTTNLMVVRRNSSIEMRVIDLGLAISSEEHQCQNESAVVRCNWKEEEKHGFDWAPPEVKAKEPFVNFLYPMHSFDVFSFGVLAVPWLMSGAASWVSVDIQIREWEYGRSDMAWIIVEWWKRLLWHNIFWYVWDTWEDSAKE